MPARGKIVLQADPYVAVAAVVACIVVDIVVVAAATRVAVVISLDRCHPKCCFCNGSFYVLLFL